VAGDGRVEKYDSEGKQLGKLDLPHIAELLKNKDELKAAAEKQLKTQRESIEKSLEAFKKEKEKLEAKKELTDAEKQNLKQYEQILKSYEQTVKFYADQKVEDVVNQMTSRLRTINGIAVSKKDVYIVCGESKGFGFAIWRMSHDFKEPKQVMGNVSGCCGQMDIQADGDDFLLAENTRYQFSRYDREGKKIGSWGKGMSVAVGKEPPCDCYGGCCNPMNLRVVGGDILTAESEGVIKRYTAKGDFIGTVAKSPLSGGCKNVAVAATPDGSKVFFCDQPGSKILILTKKKTDEKSSN
jgi:hypothetical protein